MPKTRAFHSPAAHGFVRVAAATPVVHTADPAANADEHIALIRQAADEGVDLIVFPELSVSGYAIDDLLLQDSLLEEVERQIDRICQETKATGVIAVVGAPVRHEERLYNTAVVMSDGWVWGVVPKTYLPNYREYYEKRWFAAASEELFRGSGCNIGVGGYYAAFGPHLIFSVEDRPGFTFGAEICEDFWAPLPPSTRQAMAGARILLNLSASNIVIGKAEERAVLCASQSSRTLSAYVFAASGWGESTTDLAWDGQAMIHELGAKLAEGERFALENHLTVADIDIGRIGLERLRNGTFADCTRRELRTGDLENTPRRDATRGDYVPVSIRDAGAGRAVGSLRRPLDRFPFVPDDPARLDQDCYEAFNIQVQGLMRRMKATNGERIVVGVSGGLDSTQALLVACRAFDRLGLPRTGILGYTMPGSWQGTPRRRRPKKHRT